MKTYKNLWTEFISDENIEAAIHSAKLGNKSRKLKRRLNYVYEHKEEYIPKIREIASNYHNSQHTPVTIYDGISRKKRTIIVPTPFEQVIHHMIVNVLKPIFMKSMYQHSFGSIPGRGGYLGMKTIKKWMPCKYILKMDVRKYFDNVSQRILIEKLERIIKDNQFMNILRVVIGATPIGIPLGFYTSQWFANFYLTELDHYITSELGFGHYARYMDDMVVLGNNKRQLHKLREKIADYLTGNLGLEMKGNWQIFRFDYTDRKGKRRGRPLDFMGFKFYRDKVVLRRSIMMKASRKAKRISKKKKISWYEATQMLSYCGWFKATDTYNCFQKYIKPYVNIKQLKKKVSRHNKKRYKDGIREIIDNRVTRIAT